jgi:hypothetical protein
MPAENDSQDNDLNNDRPDSSNRRDRRRLLCSDLVTVRWSSGRGFAHVEVAVLEDYASTGAGIFLTRKIDPGVSITVRTERESFGAWVKHCVWRENGYILGVEFDEPRPDNGPFVPSHLLDLSTLDL